MPFRNLGLYILVLILGFITAQNIKPDFYLMGWDNYSSYFNLPTNIFRTFFATWRDYRGLGVASDAEVTDVFRQIFYWFAHFILPEQLLDQAYYLAALWIGVLAMYWCAGLLFASRLKKSFSFLAAFFYLFNLNTLSVFYSPIVPFTNRFYGLPLTLALFLWFLEKKNKKRLLLFIIVIVVTSGSYITPTIFITSFVALALFLLFHIGAKKAIITSFVFLALNAFWLLPFGEYTRTKSSIIPLARTFVEINESTLNRPPSAFSLQKQAILYPSFFDLHFDALNGKPWTIHPLLAEYEEPTITVILFFFPLLYAAGSVLLLVGWKKNKHLLWIPVWIFVFLFLSTKAYGPLKTIPFFDIVFRIPDTKFHAYISLAGSLAAAYALSVMLSFVPARAAKLALAVFFFLVGVYVWPFRTFFTGDLIGFFSYVKLPAAYKKIAATINQTPDYGRVLHLPMDTWHSYWRSFSWGYLGSSFFHYLINKPYVDKTFEPASMENVYLQAKINSLIDRFYRATIQAEKRQAANQFLTLLQEVGIEYVIVDESINPSVSVRNLLYTAVQPLSGSKELLENLFSDGLILKKGRYTISLADLYRDYQRIYPVRVTGLPENPAGQTQLTLYQTPGLAPVFRFLPTALNVDPQLTNLLETQLVPSDTNLTQDPQKPAVLYPFLRQQHRLIRNDTSFTFEYSGSQATPTTYRIETKTPLLPSYLIDVYGKKEGEKITIRASHRYYPDINGKRFEQPIGITTYSLSPNANRLKLNDLVVPLPATIDRGETLITSFISHEPEIRLSLLAGEKMLTFSPTYPSESVVVDGPLRLSFPKALSPYSSFYDSKHDQFATSAEPCHKGVSSYRTVRREGDTTIHSMNACSGYLAREFQFAYGYPYLFAFEYWVGSGQQPLVVLGRKGDTLLMERASLYQGYPRVARNGFVSASRFIDPVFVSDTASTDMAMHLFQDTANEGVFAVRGFDMMEYPASWYGLRLVPEGGAVVYPQSQGYSYKQLLPSLWSIRLSSGQGLLQFSQGYDDGWGVYRNLWDLLFGKSIATRHYSCAGYANCFELPALSPSTYYVFYWPERLAIIGWGISLFTVIASLIVALRNRAASTLAA